MVKCQVILDAVERIAPKRLAEEWDNPGLLVGSPAQDVWRIFVCLDVSDAVVEMAIRHRVDLILTHHPLLFKAIKKIRTDLPLGRRIQKLLQHDIAVAAAHTNLDIAAGGVNDVLAQCIGLERIEPFVVTAEEDGEIYSMGRIGHLPEPLDIDSFARQVRDGLPTEYVRLVRAGCRLVRKVALCSGSGAEFIQKAAFLGADAYVTGDVRYHDAQHAVEQGMHVIDAGHFGTEFPLVQAWKARLEEELAGSGVEILADESSQDFFAIV